MVSLMLLPLMLLQIVPGTGTVPTILNAVLLLVVAPVSVWLLAKVVLANNWLGKLKDWEKRIAVAVIAAIMAGIAHALGVGLPSDLGALSQPDVQAFLVAGLAYIFHRLFKSSSPA
jgi:hypothetical protein